MWLEKVPKVKFLDSNVVSKKLIFKPRKTEPAAESNYFYLLSCILCLSNGRIARILVKNCLPPRGQNGTQLILFYELTSKLFFVLR